MDARDSLSHVIYVLFYSILFAVLVYCCLCLGHLQNLADLLHYFRLPCVWLPQKNLIVEQSMICLCLRGPQIVLLKRENTMIQYSV